MDKNVDLSQAMLGDNPEKSKNPLKKAIRRRNAKTVQFAAPTYVEASDYDYSTEDEDHLNDSFTNGDLVTDDVQEAQVADDEQKAAADAVATDGSREPTPTPNEVRDASGAVKDIKQPEDQQVVSPQIGDKSGESFCARTYLYSVTYIRSEAAPIKSRKGARPDSFLKDEAETRKITLTPNILRDDSSSLRSGDNTRGNSFESLEKTPSPVEKGKEEKKKKEKKQGMLSGLFKSKKKEKKVRTEDESVLSEMGSPELTRTSTDNSTSTLDRSSAGSLDSKSGKGAKGKLSKAPPSQLASTTASTNSPAAAATKLQLPPMEFLAELEGSQVAFEAPTGHEENMSFENRRRSRSPPPVVFRNTPHHTLEQRQRADSASKARLGWPKRAKKSDTRMELDDFDESDMDVSEETEEIEEMHQDPVEHAPKERLSESPIEIQKDGTFMHGTEAIHIPFMTGDVEESEEEPSEVGTMEEVEDDNTPTMSTPEILDASEAKDGFADTTADKAHHDSDATPTPSNPQSPQLSRDDDAVPSLTRSTPSPISSTHEPKEPHRQSSLSSTASSQPHSALSGSQASEKEKEKQWDDASLRRWLDGDNDIRDMLVVVHDKSGITPVGTDHPLMAGLFGEETKRLDEMGKELDGLLGQWMGRRQRKGNTPVPV
ncbi:protein phosphatase regulator [Zalaria obscura]|uniref:Protein phosphatase regulator n=1 Tax=Zalaria obscura TaxID=2024903 RepID=A0ACC3SPW5_9PEZI